MDVGDVLKSPVNKTGRCSGFICSILDRISSALFTLDPSVILRDKLNIAIDEIPKNPSQQINKLKELGHSLEEYTQSNEIKEEIQIAVNLINETFSSPEQVKKFEILPRDFSVDEKELTPTLKLRRKHILKNWKMVIDKIYE